MDASSSSATVVGFEPPHMDPSPLTANGDSASHPTSHVRQLNIYSAPSHIKVCIEAPVLEGPKIVGLIGPFVRILHMGFQEVNLSAI